MSEAAPLDGGSGKAARGGAPAAASAAPSSARVDGAMAGPRSAGAMIRAARHARGLQIAALAAATKVSQHKLELLEDDRVDQLPDATFARALAQTVCRFLRIDPAPVLAQLPQPGGYRLEHLGGSINTPFPGQREPGDWSVLASPAVWGSALLVLAALGLYLAPAGWLGPWPERASRWASPATAGAADTAEPPAGADAAGPPAPTAALAPPPEPNEAVPVAVVAMPQGAVGVEATPAGAGPDTRLPTRSDIALAGAPVQATNPAGGAVGPAAPTTLQLRANAESWVEVVDARSQVLLSRLLRAGETVSLDGSMPLRLKVGNAAGTEAVFRGQALNLAATTRDNVARLELK